MKLTYYESEAAKLFAQGLSKAKIAEKMQIKVSTAVGYLCRARAKLNCKSYFAMVLKLKEQNEDKKN